MCVCSLPPAQPARPNDPRPARTPPKAANPADSGDLVLGLFSVHYTEPPYATRYPELPGLLADRPCTPVGNTISDNTWCGVKAFIDTNASRAASWGSVEANNSEVC